MALDGRRVSSAVDLPDMGDLWTDSDGEKDVLMPRMEVDQLQTLRREEEVEEKGDGDGDGRKTLGICFYGQRNRGACGRAPLTSVTSRKKRASPADPFAVRRDGRTAGHDRSVVPGQAGKTSQLLQFDTLETGESLPKREQSGSLVSIPSSADMYRPQQPDTSPPALALDDIVVCVFCRMQQRPYGD